MRPGIGSAAQGQDTLKDTDCPMKGEVLTIGLAVG